MPALSRPRKQREGRIIERVQHDLSAAAERVEPASPVADYRTPEDLELPIKVLQDGSVFPGLKAMSDQWLMKTNQRPDVTEIDELLQ
jgi:hypothetical protein